MPRPEMPSEFERKDVLSALEQRLDYWSARAILGDLTVATGLKGGERFTLEDVTSLVLAADEAGDATSAKAAAALRAAFALLTPEEAAAAAEQAAREAAAREAEERAARERAEREAAERAAREKAEREAAEKAAAEKAAREAEAKAAAERAAAEKAAREAEAKAAAAKAAAEQAAREAAEKAAAEQAAREQAEREAAERAAAERALLQVIVAAPGELRVDPGRPVLLLGPAGSTFHWGVNGWKAPPDAFLPPGTVRADDGNAHRTPLAPQADQGDRFGVVLPSFASQGGAVKQVDLTFQLADGSWWEGTAALRPVPKKG